MAVEPQALRRRVVLGIDAPTMFKNSVQVGLLLRVDYSALAGLLWDALMVHGSHIQRTKLHHLVCSVFFVVS